MIYRFSLPLVFFVVSFFSLNAQQLTFEGDTVSTNDQLGFDVAMTENFGVSAAWQKNIWYQGELKEEAGCVYLHKKEKGEWVYQERITCPEPRKDDSFGRSIAISEDYLVVGAASRNQVAAVGHWAREGAVYIYEYSDEGYVFKHELKSDKLEGDARFGEKVALGGDYLAVVCNYPEIGLNSNKYVGAVLVYKLSKELAPIKIGAFVSASNAGLFDYSVEIYGNTMVLGEEGKRISIYNLEGESVDLKQELLPQEGFESDFGHDVAASDDYIVVGASGGDYDFYGVEFDSSIDSLYSLMMIDDETGRFAMKYIQNNKADMEKYGVSSEVFKKGAKPYETWEEYSARKGGAGAVYVYKKEKDGYKLSQTLMASDRKADDNFGMCVEIEGDLIVVGAFGKASSQGGKDEDRFAGAAYAFKLNKGKWKEVKKYQEQNPKGWDKFGFSVACCKDDIMIGCRLKDVEKDGTLIEDAGTVYFYKKP
ncbi:hypothetical protein Oweho_2700 [Owenweeksia hongkongensis DSM 17368]|uniref:FG-GAP repeat protein n=1 Tax=Owenweeksia hongkongensis (strain DSM 17368 / CIP 108786 / JCM 12287 / NRRL B-23963 / UST20020801) TaxID=926562 RepID=G8QZL0_OWEHD|nr:FG-GAP repeat protein [Owenweeksia hongkongensis]AEV33663.1 hypothetical protein Oweho_2700 [Owenweeksia hongkongensis DSM 17368]